MASSSNQAGAGQSNAPYAFYKNNSTQKRRPISEEFVNRIKNNRWLTDEHIEIFSEVFLYQNTCKNIRNTVKILEPFILTKINEYLIATGEARQMRERVLLKSYQKKNLKDCRVVIFPVEIQSHWMLAIVYGNQIFVFDSLQTYLATAKIIAERIRAFLQLGADHFRGPGEQIYNEEQYPLVYPPCPVQGNTYDCGVFTLDFLLKFLNALKNHSLFKPEDIIGKELQVTRQLLLSRIETWARKTNTAWVDIDPADDKEVSKVVASLKNARKFCKQKSIFINAIEHRFYISPQRVRVSKRIKVKKGAEVQLPNT